MKRFFVTYCCIAVIIVTKRSIAPSLQHISVDPLSYKLLESSCRLIIKCPCSHENGDIPPTFGRIYILIVCK